jgi:putative membrane protein
MVTRLLTKILINAAALWVADYLIAGFSVFGGIWGFLVAGLVLALLNMLVRPLVKLVALPLIILTLGLFRIVINGAMIWIAVHFFDLGAISGLMALVWATLIVGLVNAVLDRD